MCTKARSLPFPSGMYLQIAIAFDEKNRSISACGFSQGSLRSPHTSLTITDERARCANIYSAIIELVTPAKAGAYTETALASKATNHQTKKNPKHFCMGFLSGLLAEPK